MELPLGIIGIAIATVILPTLSRIHSRGDTVEFGRTLDWGLRCIVVMGLPASVALVSLAHPLIITLYQRGEFGVDSVVPTAQSLQAYSLACWHSWRSRFWHRRIFRGKTPGPRCAMASSPWSATWS
jgi:putative peptidoglycan lipid II flippase